MIRATWKKTSDWMPQRVFSAVIGRARSRPARRAQTMAVVRPSAGATVRRTSASGAATRRALSEVSRRLFHWPLSRTRAKAAARVRTRQWSLRGATKARQSSVPAIHGPRRSTATAFHSSRYGSAVP
jgi:hypothetical protein